MRTFPRSARAARARALVEELQLVLVRQLEDLSDVLGAPSPLVPVDWLRDEGRHGGGRRYEASETATLARASANVSVVHYDDTPSKRLASATALSCIVHPRHPRAPSLHLHLSWTELKDSTGYWRIMVDLNPSIPVAEDAARLRAELRAACPALADDAFSQGDRYFYIPALARHRGVVHYYLEGHKTEDWDADAALAREIGDRSFRTYDQLLRQHCVGPEPTREELAAQRAYHTLYLLQVLTLDRGTTAGLLVHSQNDVGILGSLPPKVDLKLLEGWRDRLPELQRPLLDAVVGILKEAPGRCIEDREKALLAEAVRAHYRSTPEALRHQASGGVVPPTLANHR